MNPPDDAVVAEKLLAVLRDHSGSADLQFVDPPSRIQGGFECFTYGFSVSAVDGELAGPLILRMFTDKGAINQGRREAAFQNALAELGYPVPRVVALSDGGTSDRPFNVMERVRGHPMMSELSLDEAGIASASSWLARIHTRLHSIPAQPVISALEEMGFPRDEFSISKRIAYLERYFTDDRLDQFRPGMDWLRFNRPAERELQVVCHGDFHPANIMVDGGKVTGVIDWPGAAIADPEFDVAVTLVLIKIAAGGMFPEAVQVLARFADLYLSAYREIAVLDPVKVEYYEALRCFRAFIRGAASTTPQFEPELLPRDNYPWASAYAKQALSARFLEVTGVDLATHGSD